MSKAPDFGGEEHFKSSPDKLFSLLTNLDAMAKTIPDLQSYEKVDDTTMNAVVRPGFSFLRGTMKIKLTVDEAKRPESAAMTVVASSIGVGMTIVSNLTISADGDGSKLDWNATIAERKGLVSAVSPALLKGAADQIIRHSWSSVRKELGEV